MSDQHEVEVFLPPHDITPWQEPKNAGEELPGRPEMIQREERNIDKGRPVSRSREARE